MATSEQEAFSIQAARDFEDRLSSARSKRDSLMAEAQFYANPDWQSYLKEVLEPRYRSLADQLVEENETASILRLQGEARNLRYQMTRAASVLADLEEAKEELFQIEKILSKEI